MSMKTYSKVNLETGLWVFDLQELIGEIICTWTSTHQTAIKWQLATKSCLQNTCDSSNSKCFPTLFNLHRWGFQRPFLPPLRCRTSWRRWAAAATTSWWRRSSPASSRRTASWPGKVSSLRSLGWTSVFIHWQRRWTYHTLLKGFNTAKLVLWISE